MGQTVEKVIYLLSKAHLVNHLGPTVGQGRHGGGMRLLRVGHCDGVGAVDQYAFVMSMHLQRFYPLSRGAVGYQHGYRAVFKLKLGGGQGFVEGIGELGTGLHLDTFAAEITENIHHVNGIFQGSPVFTGRTVLLGDQYVRGDLPIDLLRFAVDRSIPAIKGDHQLPACPGGGIRHVVSLLQGHAHGLFTKYINPCFQQSDHLLGVDCLG